MKSEKREKHGAGNPDTGTEVSLQHLTSTIGEFRKFAGGVALVLLVAFAGCSSVEERFGLEREAVEDDRPQVTYEVQFEGSPPDELLSLLRTNSEALQKQNEPPRSRAAVRRRASSDVEQLTAVLRSEGYYSGSVAYRLEEPATDDDAAGEQEGATAATPLTIVYEIDAGPRYSLDTLEIEVEGPAEGYVAPSPLDLGLETGAPARADPVIEADTRLQSLAREGGRAFAASGDRQIFIDREQETMDVTLRIKPGLETPFGPVSFEGVEGIDEDWLRKRVNLEPGASFSPEKLDAARQSLSSTGLFSTARALPATELDADGQLPVTFDMRQRKQRTIGFGAGFQTDEGPFGRAFWEHRNIFGAGEKLQLNAEASFIRQEINATFVKPDLPYRSWNLLAETSAGFEETDAFDSKFVEAGVAVERPFGEGVTGAIGVAYRLAEIEEPGEDADRVALLSLPTRLDWNFSDSLLDPSTGGRVFIRSTPFIDTAGLSLDGTKFWRNEITTTRYVTVVSDPRLVLAFRGRVGSIVGASREDIPADERFYAGGGGSIRGVPFQKAGPLDDNDDPIGGRSLLELSGEIRYRVTDSLGLVAFVDAGTVYEDTYPDFGEELEVGVGPGLRYITPIGPLRLDVGFPVDRRSGVDDPFQLYVSIGQAF